MSNTAQPAGRMMLKNVRLAFPSLFEPTTVAGEGSPRFSAALLLPPDHPQIAEIHKKMKAVAAEKWGAKATTVYTGIEKSDKLALHDGDTKSNYDGFPGNLFLNAAAREDAPPTVLDSDAQTHLNPRSGKPYAGCYVDVSIDFWAQDNNYGKRINAQLRGVMFRRDGDAFAAGRPADSSEFEAATEGADAEDMV